MNFFFLHPWAVYAGVAVAGLPFAIHWLTRPKPKTLGFSAIRFIEAALRHRRAISRLRDWLILGLRAVAVLLLAWAISRPMFGVQPQEESTTSAPRARIVLLDVSQSMAAQSQGIDVLQKAKAAAANYLVDEPGLRSNVILVGARPRPFFDRLSLSAASLRSELANVEALPEKANFAAAIRRAAEIFAKETDADAETEIVILSDYQRTNWVDVEFDSLPKKTKIHHHFLAGFTSSENVGILRVAAANLSEDAQDIRLEVDVGNFTASNRKVTVDVSLENARCRLEGVCPPGSTTLLTTDLTLPGHGWRHGTAKLIDTRDAMAADNERAFVLHAREERPTVLLTRQSADTKPSSSYYLQSALSPGRKTAKPRVARMEPAAWDVDALQRASVFLLDHPGKLTVEQVRMLSELVRRGRGLLYVVSEAEDAANLGRFTEALGTSWQPPVAMAPAKLGQRRRNLFLTDIRKDAFAFNVFGDQVESLTDLVRIHGGLESRRVETGPADDVVASLSDRSAFLVLSNCGAGQMAILNADLEASNLALQPIFVPLLGEIVRKLAGGQKTGESFILGEPASFVLGGDAAPANGLKLQSPGGDSANLPDLVEGATGITWNILEGAKPGLYAVRRGDVVVHAAAAVISPEESDLRPLALDELKERGGARQVRVQVQENDEDAQDQAWVWLLAACVICMTCECLVLRAFRT